MQCFGIKFTNLHNVERFTEVLSPSNPIVVFNIRILELSVIVRHPGIHAVLVHVRVVTPGGPPSGREATSPPHVEWGLVLALFFRVHVPLVTSRGNKRCSWQRAQTRWLESGYVRHVSASEGNPRFVTPYMRSGGEYYILKQFLELAICLQITTDNKQ